MALLNAKFTNPREGGASFSFSHRAKRFVWGIVWGTMGKWTPSPLHFWRRFLLKAFGAKLHSTAKVYPGVSVWYPSNLEMRAFSCLGPDVKCYSMGRITLDDYALVSQRAYLCGGSHDIDSASFQLIVKPIYIGKNAWVAAEAFVGPGVVVGEGSVLGARSVCVKDTLPWVVYAGNPARKIRARLKG